MSKITHSEHYKVKKFIIYKISDDETSKFPVQFLTLKALRNYVINNIWVEFDNCHDSEQELTQEDLFENDENIFAYLEYWNIKIERIVVTDLI